MKKRKKKEFWHPQFFIIKVDVWDLEVAVSIGLNGKETYDRLKFLKVAKEILDDAMPQLKSYDDDGAAVHGRMFSLLRGYLICIKPFKGDFRKTLGLLVHELTHVSHYILRDRRMPLVENNEEAYTYLIQFLTENALKEMY